MSYRDLPCLLLTAFVIIGFMRCNDTPSGPVDTDAPQTTHTVNTAGPTIVVDSTVGVVLAVPANSHGSVTVAKTALLPGMDEFDTPFTVTTIGFDSLAACIVADSGHNAHLFVFLPFGGTCHDGVSDSTEGFWAPLPAADSSGDSIFFPFLPTTAGAAKRTDFRYSGSPVYKAVKLPRKKDYDSLYAAFEAHIRTALTQLVDSLEPSKQAGVKNIINTTLSPRLYLAMNSAWYRKLPYLTMDNCKYVPFYEVLTSGLYPACVIQLYDAATKGNIAHETGHYFHHVLVGSEAFAQFANNTRPPEHGIGTGGSAFQFIEEPAYLAEYMLTGSVKGIDPMNGMMISDMNNNKTPDQIDYPDREGFGVSMLVQFIRPEGRVKNYRDEWQNVPVIKNGCFADAFSIVAQNASDVFMVRRDMEKMLDSRGQESAMPALMQPLGWVYKVRGYLVDSTGGAIRDARVRPVCKTGGTEFCLDKTTTGSDHLGRFSLPEMYPGYPGLRVYLANGDSIDVDSVRVGWDSPTNSEISLGDITVRPKAEDLLTLLHRMKKFDFEAHFGLDTVANESQGTSGMSASDDSITWNGRAFSYDHTDCDTSFKDDGSALSTSACQTKISGTVSADIRKLETCTYFEESVHNYYGRISSISRVTMTMNNVPLVKDPFYTDWFDDTPYGNFLYAFADADSAKAQLASFNFYSQTGEGENAYILEWNDASHFYHYSGGDHVVSVQFHLPD